ncbi:MAG: glycine cleavage system aminomethyltransferase GcvT [candidate division Zixibacteria bacterium]|nr:glycine cleavage system aminomethyltransferase GcvT [candidate division Zixibacteria bacterium]
MSNKAIVKRTPFCEYHEAAGAKMVAFAGYYMPIQYKGITEEHLAVRKNVGMFDLSHMGEFEVTGNDALAFLQKTTTNNVAVLKSGEIQYNCMTYDNGGIVDDLLVYRMEDRFFLVVNAANIDKDFAWLSSHLEGDAVLENHSDDFGLLAIQGPNAEKVLAKMTSYNLAEIPYYHHVTAEIAGVELMFSRTGYTGEDGFELYIPPEHCATLWEAAIAAGREFNMELIGLGARDTLRLEMKMALYGNDIDQTTTPIEAGLGWIVNLEKDFIGKDIIARQKEEKPPRRLVCLEMNDKVFPRHGYDIYSDEKVVGQVTSGTFSPSLQKPIALGYVPRELSKSGSAVEIDIRKKRFPAVVVKPPFYKNGTHK